MLRNRPSFETLESRRLLAVDLNFSDVFDGLTFVASDGSSLAAVADPTPVAGQKVYVAADWSAVGLADAEAYEVRFDMDGVALPVDFTGADFPGWFHGGWLALPGETHTITITLDANDQIVEDDETNNVLSLEFSTREPQLPTKLSLPLSGEQNVDWTLSGYVDVNPQSFIENPGNSFADYLGRSSTTREFHNGLDLAIANFAAQDAGVEVYAAAPGVVTFVEDGHFDRETGLTFAEPGNRVFIDHGEGWATQYYHFRRDSIAVSVGEVVEAGTLLGLVGSSGNSAGPHLHFEILHLGSPVEPFLAPAFYFGPADFDHSGRTGGSDFVTWQRSHGFDQATSGSGDANGDGVADHLDRAVWETTFGQAPPPDVYDAALPSALVDFGVTNDIQSGAATGFGLPLDQFRERPSEVTAFPGAGEWLLAWGVFSAIEAGDAWEAQLFRPDGSQVVDFEAATFVVDRPIDTGLYNPGLTEDIPGTWRVDFLLNGTLVGRRELEVGVARPEIRVFARDAADENDVAYLLDGRATPVDFGTAQVGASPVRQNFRIENHGYADLVVGSVQLPEGYQVFQPLPSTVAAGQSATWGVEFAPALEGLSAGDLAILTNDADEGTFTFAVEGVGIGSGGATAASAWLGAAVTSSREVPTARPAGRAAMSPELTDDAVLRIFPQAEPLSAGRSDFASQAEVSKIFFEHHDALLSQRHLEVWQDHHRQKDSQADWISLPVARLAGHGFY